MFKLSKKSIAAGSAVLVLAGGGVAFAYWTSTGNGSGTGTVAAGADNVITLSTEAIDGLAPEGSVEVEVTAANSSDQAYSVENYSVTEVTTSDETCSPDWFTTEVAPVLTRVAGGASEVVGTLTVYMPQNLDVPQNGCKGATITVGLKTPAGE